jgi:putative addiction module component (TIGR02574 family)
MANALLVPPAGFDDLPVDEQIDDVNFLWDRITDKSAERAFPEWQEKMLDERLAARAANPNAGEPWDHVYAELKADIALSRKVGNP